MNAMMLTFRVLRIMLVLLHDSNHSRDERIGQR